MAISDINFWSAELLKYRMRRCLTQEELAKMCGVSKNCIARIERKENYSVSVKTIGKIMNATGIKYE